MDPLIFEKKSHFNKALWPSLKLKLKVYVIYIVDHERTQSQTVLHRSFEKDRSGIEISHLNQFQEFYKN